MKRKLLVGGLLVIAALTAAAGADNWQAVRSDPRDSQTIIALQHQYSGVDADDIRLAEWRPVPLPTNLPSAEERQQELAKIERETNLLASEKRKLEAAIADGERAIKAVETDYTNGKLTKSDADMLFQMFREKVDKHQSTLEQSNKRLNDLDIRKKELLAYKEPESIVYTQAEVDRGLLTYRTTVFFNTVQQRLLTKDEIQKHPVASKLNVETPPTLSWQAVRNILLTCGIIACVLILFSSWRRSKDQAKRLTNITMMNQNA